MSSDKKTQSEIEASAKKIIPRYAVKSAPQSTSPKKFTHSGTSAVGKIASAKKNKAEITREKNKASAEQGSVMSSARFFTFRQSDGMKTLAIYGIKRKNRDKDALPFPSTKNCPAKKNPADRKSVV